MFINARFVIDVFHLIFGIKHGLSCINFHQVPREMSKTERFQHLLKELANVNALKINA